MEDRLHPKPSFPPQEPAFTIHDVPQGFSCDSAEQVSSRPPSGYVQVASPSPIDLSSPSTVSPHHSQERLMSDSFKLVTAHRQDSQSPSSEQNTKQPASQKLTVHYPDDVDQGLHFNIPPKIDSRASSVVGSDADDEEDDFDWSGDENLEDEEAKFEKQTGVKLQSRHSLWRLFTFLFSTLIGSVFLAGILVTAALLVHFFWYKPHPTDDRHYIAQNIEAWLFWAAANVVISWALAMIVDIIPFVIRMLISLSWGHVSEEVKTHLELYISVKDIFKPVLYASSAWVSWVILFQNIFHLHDTTNDIQSYAAYTDRVSQAIEFLFFFAVVFCAQRMLSHALAFAFHRTAFKERLEELDLGLRVIEQLRNYKPKHRHQKSNSHTPISSSRGFMAPFSEKEGFNFLGGRQHAGNPVYPSDDEGDIEIDGQSKSSKGKGKHKPKESKSWSKTDCAVDISVDECQSTPGAFGSGNDSPYERPNTPHRYLPTSARGTFAPDHHDDYNPALQAARVFKSAVLHDARNIQGNTYDLSDLVTSLDTTYEAKRLARAIYIAFRDRHRTYLIPSDFYPAFHTHEEAENAFRVFDRDNNGDISRSEVKSTLLRIYKERRFLSRSIRDVRAALKLLNHILLLISAVILFFISLSVFGVNVTQSLTSVYTLGLAASFVFKNSASNAFDAIMFLFVTHPFDTGDRCFIDNENLVVKKMGLFATVFTRSDGTESYYFNSQLFTKFITNVRRSDKMAEALTMQIAWHTPLEKLDELEKRINEWLATEENRWFQPTTTIMLQNINFQRSLEITIGIPHNATWQDWGLRNTRRTAFHAAVHHYCRQLGIVYYESPMPIAYADVDTQLYTPLPEASAEGDNMSAEIDVAPRNLMGFTPPHMTGSDLKARKSRSRKAAMRTAAGDG
ncbi:Mechanosensitive ion channel-domain-containing protein [Scleroderma yunnanense]